MLAGFVASLEIEDVDSESESEPELDFGAMGGVFVVETFFSEEEESESLDESESLEESESELEDLGIACGVAGLAPAGFSCAGELPPVCSLYTLHTSCRVTGFLGGVLPNFASLVNSR